jgi:Domain of Unknown Function (DUF748)
MTAKTRVLLTSHKKVTIPFILLIILLACLPVAVKITATNWLEKNGAGQVSLRDVDLNIFAGTLGIEGFSIQKNEKQKIRLSELKLNVSVLNLFRKRVLVEALTIDGLDMALEKDQEQLHFGMSIPLASGDGSKADDIDSQKSKTSLHLGVSNINIINSKLAYHQTDLSCQTTINRIRLQDLYTWVADTPARIDMDTRINGSPLTANIQLNAFSNEKKARVTITLKRLSLAPFSALAAPAMEGLQGYLDLDNDLSITMAEDGQIQAEQSGDMTIVDIQGILKPAAGKSLSLEDLDVGWKGATAISLSPDRQPVSIKMEGTLTNDHLVAWLSLPETSIQHQGIHVPISVTCDNLEDLNTLEANASIQMKNLHLSNQDLGIELLSLGELLVESIHMQGRDRIHVARLATRDLVVGKPDKAKHPSIAENLLNNKSMAIEDIQLLGQSHIVVNSMDIHEFSASVFRNKDAELPLITLLKQVSGAQTETGHETEQKPSSDDVAPTPDTEMTAEDGALGVKIGTLFFSGKNTVHIVDESLDPTFDRTIIIDELSVKNIDNSHINNPADLLLSLHVDKHAAIETKGTIQPFSPKVDLDLAGFVKNIHLPMISPYLSQSLGYIVQTGVLSLDYTAKANAGILDINNDITIKNIKLMPDDQEKIDQISKQLTMPLDTALSILRDKNNDVTLSLPVSGDIENPDFNLNDVMAIAVKKALKMGSVSVIKHLLQPYGALVTIANLAKKGGEYLAEIKLDPIDFEPGSAELTPRAGDYLKTIHKLLTEKEGLRLTICGTSIPGDLPDLTVDGNKDAFVALADQRATGIQDYFVAQGISVERLFVCNPALNTDEEAKPLVTLSL